MKKILIFSLTLFIGLVLVACSKELTTTTTTTVETTTTRKIAEGSGAVPTQSVTEFCKVINNTYDYESLNYELVWSDEFNGTELDLDNWTHEIGGSGWGNNELQYYTDSSKNSYVQDGSLFIKLLKEVYQDNNYTSARLVTKRNHDFLYGKFEMRAKLPSGLGTWPAFWMMPTDSYYGGWPNSGEIDIMEHVGYDMNHIHHSIHTEFFNHPNNTQKGDGAYHDNVDTVFHTYSLEWLPDKLMYYVDGDLQYTYDINQFDCVKKGHWPFDKDFFLILNLAFGGSWGGAQGIDSTLLEATYEIDYVRVYQDSTIS
jgi:beta-glucanase (GH16 family)